MDHAGIDPHPKRSRYVAVGQEGAPLIEAEIGEVEFFAGEAKLASLAGVVSAARNSDQTAGDTWDAPNPYHGREQSAQAKRRALEVLRAPRVSWRARQDSNLQPSDSKSATLSN